MEIKKCARCGQFFETVNSVCNSCIAKDNKDIGKLKNYFSYGYIAGKVSLGDIANDTGITMKNLNRLILNEEFEGVYIPETLNELDNNIGKKKIVAKV